MSNLNACLRVMKVEMKRAIRMKAVILKAVHSKLKSSHDLASDIIDLEAQMKKYSEDLDFERAIECRDRIKRLEKELKLKDDRK